MKIFVCASRHLYDKIRSHVDELKRVGHEITPPNCYDDPGCGARMKETLTPDKYSEWKASMLDKQIEKVTMNEAVLVFNCEKNGQENYIGGATFLEIFKAWELKKKIFLWNPIPEGMLYDELIGMKPTVVNRDLNKIV
ncbi:MAG: hypothetical protein HZA95_03060 [Candidatus Vogelbacteria bacterium]|nr:hypothetical protein [Candidatus Vogelbacteria bacterium]